LLCEGIIRGWSGTEKPRRDRVYAWASWGAAVLRPYMIVLTIEWWWRMEKTLAGCRRYQPKELKCGGRRVRVLLRSSGERGDRRGGNTAGNGLWLGRRGATPFLFGRAAC